MMGIMTTTVDSSDSMPERLQEGSAAPDFTLPAGLYLGLQRADQSTCLTCLMPAAGLYCTSTRPR